ncbi:MAG: ABC transporter ATP-binding protein [Myxococcota bacterium]|nr:ABC transporter ATP-binding protein [Myxococcota bacterium]
MTTSESLAATGAHVQARELGRRFGDHAALDRVSLEVQRGETFGLLGANGAGKTTFIRICTGYLVPTSGSLRVDGISPAEHPRGVQERLGYVTETSRLYPELRVQGFLRFAGGARGLRGSALDEAVESALDRFDLTAVARRLVGNLSKGYQQRVSLAQAFLHDPALVIVDEPTSGLDPLQQGDVREILAELQGQRTVILCTHDLAEARALTSRVAVLSHGRLLRTGPTEEILGEGDPLDLFRRAVSEDALHGDRA